MCFASGVYKSACYRCTYTRLSFTMLFQAHHSVRIKYNVCFVPRSFVAVPRIAVSQQWRRRRFSSSLSFSFDLFSEGHTNHLSYSFQHTRAPIHERANAGARKQTRQRQTMFGEFRTEREKEGGVCARERSVDGKRLPVSLKHLSKYTQASRYTYRGARDVHK